MLVIFFLPDGILGWGESKLRSAKE
jgi:hypothetical protein